MENKVIERLSDLIRKVMGDAAKRKKMYYVHGGRCARCEGTGVILTVAGEKQPKKPLTVVVGPDIAQSWKCMPANWQAIPDNGADRFRDNGTEEKK